jgi:rhodanese-related sulfurtransferase
MKDQILYYEQKLKYEIDAYDLFIRVRQGEDIILVDVRSEDNFEMERIPTAINIPHEDINEENMDGYSKEQLYVVYCDGIGCNASTKGALKLTMLGFNVKELQGGLDWWKKDGYSTEGEAIELQGGGCCGGGGDGHGHGHGGCGCH